MLRRENRLQKGRDFQKVFKNSRPVFVNNLSVRVSQKPGALSPARFGFVISNKVDKRSTRRNALKRRLRVVTREILPLVKPGLDIVVIVKSNFKYPYQLDEIKEQLREALTRAKAFR